MTAKAASIDLGQQQPTRLGRLTWIDIARGVAIVAMAIYHFAWDLEFFGYAAPGMTADGGWKLFARAIASSFLFLAGVSLVLGHYPAIRWQPFLKRLAMIAAAAAVITIATYIATPERFIFFGILHAIAAASLVGLLFLRLPPLLTLVAALAAFLAPFYLRSAIFNAPALWWVGLSLPHPPSNDYVPLLPWLAPVLAGIGLTRIAVSRGWLAIFRRDARNGPLARLLILGGRHSLVVYLLHQPVLIGLIYAASLVYPAPAADPVVSYQRSCTQSCEANQGAEFCQRFCDCTLGELLDRRLFNDVMAGRITPANNTNVADVADQCTTNALQAQ